MNINWTSAYNRLFKIINLEGDTYYSGPKFIKTAQEVDDNIPSYTQYLEMRKQQNKSTSRKDFFWDIINDLEEQKRFQLFNLFIDDLGTYAKDSIEGVKTALFGSGTPVPTTVIPQKNLEFREA